MTNQENLKEVYDKFEKVPEWVKVMAHKPNILKNFVGLFDSIMKEGDIDPILKWKIAYMVSQTLKCEFCLDVTEKMLKKMDISDEILVQIKESKSEGDEKIILELVEDVSRNGYTSNIEAMYELSEKLGEAKMVEIVSVIGLFNYINRFNNMFVVLPE